MTRVLLFLTSADQMGDTGRPTGYFLAEAAHPWKVFTDAGWEIAFASPKGGHSRIDGADETDPAQAEFLAEYGPLGPEAVKADAIDPAAFDVVLMVGGHGTMWDFRGDADLQAIGRSVWEQGGIVAAVCHGPAGLVDLRLSDGSLLVAGRHVAAFTDNEEATVGLADVVPFALATTLNSQGAIHVPAPNWSDHVVVDGRLITGQNPASAASLARAVVAKVGESATTG